jgi:hypothetical protein
MIHVISESLARTRTRTRNEFTTKRVVVILKCCTEYP